MRNAQTSVAGHRLLCSGPANDTQSLRELMINAGLSAGLCFEWLIDRYEQPDRQEIR